VLVSILYKLNLTWTMYSMDSIFWRSCLTRNCSILFRTGVVCPSEGWSLEEEMSETAANETSTRDCGCGFGDGTYRNPILFSGLRRFVYAYLVRRSACSG